MFKHKNKITYRLLVNIIISISIMTILIGFSVSEFMKQSLEQELELRLNTESNFSKSQIENLFIDSTAYVNQLLGDKNIVQYLFEVDERSQIETHYLIDEVLNTIRSMEKSTNQIFLISLVNEAANFYLDNHAFVSDEGYDVYIRPWHAVALESEGVNYTDPYVEWGTKELVVSSIKAVEEPNGDKSFVVVDFSLNILPSVVSKMNVGEKGQVFIINGSGKFIYHKDDSNVLEKSLIDVYPQIDEWLNHKTVSDGVFEVISIDDEDYYILTSDIEYSKWKIVTLVNQDEVRAEMNKFIAYLVGTIVLFTVIVTIVIYFFIRKRLKPIAALTIYSQQIALGNLDEDLPYEYVALTDEMGTIAKSFVTIAEVFKQKNQILEDTINAQYEEIKQQYHYIIEKEKIASLGFLVAGIAHEINTPVGNALTTGSYMKTIVKKLDDLQANGKLTKSELVRSIEALDEASDLVQRNVERAADLVKQFKTIATNQNNETLQKVNLKEEVGNIIETIRLTIKTHSIEIINNVDDDIIMRTFPSAISQILTNFIKNSFQYAYAEDEKGLIRIGAYKEGQLVKILYEDDGKGIEPSILEHIFEPFYTTRRSTSNSGLGMFIIHNLINQTLSGNIRCESEVNQGVKFYLTIPLELNEE
ncbi:MAG: sensor histidine kinase [Clostridiales bacterium]|nr:sensor histidine kinase [Clostridiales bacterium]